MSAYIIADVDVTNPQQYEQYKVLSSQAIAAHGAEICIRGGAVEVLEGDWSPTRIVLLKFPDLAAARSFYDSAEYLLARQARAGAATMRMIAVQGV
ncbi:conserved hypothetical protein [Thiomonas arsenitoxydans]|uniref:DUF1330 domain-containing protein n=1 Tax=Thiomonas arsenitoxydans (strain DSM 22701 / CIP 110005 / 3As) TaxID=426114 RepID=D6CVF3_THIA3|nr:DUF1330 domain-containing protein [Thiomonas arsenitoxydans]CAZ89272.1 conserved hypothetical protein [Thiomonas arsenitoxydans]CQR34216.1 conserved hypothetical protein [Thiomonas arsenitoxydans]CQR35250.1 conserved hypothetical protein [Thiomonas arsenitoxydans]CQR37468.1 conserved hypothetical protein [Thiomonas arsenitoxydans]CQR37642.1 conserved hypothetical protein [Thiomonas arsenitoxydans]